MKKSLLFFAASLLAFVASAAPKTVFEDGSFLFAILDPDDNKVSLVGYADKTLPDDLVIPAEAKTAGKTYVVTELGYRAFSDNSVSTTESFDKTWSQSPASFKTAVIPNTIETIGQGAFNGCAALETVTFGNSVKVIGQGAFRYCSALKDVVIPDCVTTIEQGAFNGCTVLESVTIGTGVELLDQRVFLDCPELAKIISLSTTPPAAKQNTFNNIAADAVVYVPAGTADAYKAATGWAKLSQFSEMGSVSVELSASEIELNVDGSATITATVTKNGDVEICSESWETSNKEVAQVSNSGVVTAMAEGSATITCKVTDNFGRTHSAICEVTVKNLNGLHTVIDQSDAPVEYFNLLGNKMDADNLTPGIYIRKQNNTTQKVIIR